MYEIYSPHTQILKIPLLFKRNSNNNNNNDKDLAITSNNNTSKIFHNSNYKKVLEIMISIQEFLLPKSIMILQIIQSLLQYLLLKHQQIKQPI